MAEPTQSHAAPIRNGRDQAFRDVQAKQAGHEYEVIYYWMIEDDADFRAECSCGWIGYHRCASGAHALGRAHLNEAALLAVYDEASAERR